MSDKMTARAVLEAARREGRAAWLGKRDATNPHPRGSLEARCWDAGYRQDVRSIEEIERAGDAP